jgi:hypothetical protein
MASERAVTAAVAAITTRRGPWPSIREHVRAALDAAEAENAEERRENCKHTNKFGSGSVSSDGSWHISWYCRDCGRSYEASTPAHPVSDAFITSEEKKP